MSEPIAVHSVLALAPQHQANYIFWRLALAMGYAKGGDGRVSLDPDLLLTEVEAVIKEYVAEDKKHG